MADPYRFDFFETITAISFPAKKDLCFVSFDYAVDGNNAQPAPINPTLQGLPYPGSWTIFDDVKAGTSSFVPVVSPVSADMRNKLYQWTPSPAYTNLTKQPFPPTIVYYVTTGAAINAQNFLNPYPGTDNCGTPVKVIGAYGGTVFNCNGSLLNDAAAHGIDITRITYGMGFDGQFSTSAAASYNAAAFNATQFAQSSGLSLTVGQFTYIPAGTLYTLVGRANFIINLGLAKTTLAKGVTTFKFILSATPPQGGAWHCGAAVSQATTFPVDGKNKPIFRFPDSAVAGSGNIQITGTIDVGKKTVALTTP